MQVCLFEDGASTFEPLTLTRPVFELWCGQGPLSGKQTGLFPSCRAGALVRPHLAEVYRRQRTSFVVNDFDWLRADTTAWINGRWLPPEELLSKVSAPCVGLVEGELAYAIADAQNSKLSSLEELPERIEIWKRTLPCHAAGGTLVRYPWQLVEQNRQQLCADFFRVPKPRNYGSPLTLVGPSNRIIVDPTARIDPFVVADTNSGPIVIDAGAVITAFTRLEGPCYIGKETHVFGAKIRAGTTIGPHCRVGGEVEASIIQGYSNKYHDGFLGHSYVGEWVNLGAGTHNSDLRNDYGPVSVILDGRSISTGLTKVGCFIGDHTKTGLGTLLNTGSNLGAFCNLLPAGSLAPKYMPSFTTWWNGSLRENADWPKLLATAREVMERRGSELTEMHADLYSHVLERTRLERRCACREFEHRHLRRSA